MSSQLPTKNPTGYVGLRETNVGQLYFRDHDPNNLVDFRPYTAGDRWINTVANHVWTLVKKTTTSGTWVGFSGGAGDIEQVTPSTGAAIVPMANNINIFGTAAQGVTTTNTAVDTITVSVNDATTASKGVAQFNPTYFSVAAGVVSLTSPYAFVWLPVPGAVAILIPNVGWYTTAGLTAFTMPVACPVGSIIKIIDATGAGWTITQLGGQNIIFGFGSATSAGAGVRVASTQPYEGLELLCIVADTTWIALNIKGNPLVI
jgi:hypothetical protein